jgi:hypothetical protein
MNIDMTEAKSAATPSWSQFLPDSSTTGTGVAVIENV